MSKLGLCAVALLVLSCGGRESADDQSLHQDIQNNTSLAQQVPVHKGDGVVIHGELYIDPGPRYGVHCTHVHTSSGCPNPGWIEYNNNYYE